MSSSYLPSIIIIGVNMIIQKFVLRFFIRTRYVNCNLYLNETSYYKRVVQPCVRLRTGVE